MTNILIWTFIIVIVLLLLPTLCIGIPTALANTFAKILSPKEESSESVNFVIVNKKSEIRIDGTLVAISIFFALGVIFFRMGDLYTSMTSFIVGIISFIFKIISDLKIAKELKTKEKVFNDDINEELYKEFKQFCIESGINETRAKEKAIRLYMSRVNRAINDSE